MPYNYDTMDCGHHDTTLLGPFSEPTSNNSHASAVRMRHKQPKQTVAICLNGEKVRATLEFSQSNSVQLQLVWLSTGESWAGHYGSEFISRLLPGRPFEVFLQMLRAALVEHERPASGLRLHLDKATVENPEQLHLVVTCRTRFEQIECRLPLTRQRAGTDADDEDQKLDAAGLREAARQLEQENARLRRENARLRPAAESAVQLRLEVAAMREAARSLEAELQSSVASTPRRAAAGKASVKKLQLEARELRAMERGLQLRLRQVLQELALHKRARVHGPLAGAAVSTKSASTSRITTPRGQRQRFDPTAYVTERQQRRRRRSGSADRERPRSATSTPAAAISKKPTRPSSSSTAAGGIRGIEEDVLQIDERLNRLQNFLNKALIVR